MDLMSKKSGSGTRKMIVRAMVIGLGASIAITAMPQTAEAQRRTLLEQWFPKAAQRMRQQREDRLRRTRPDLFATERQRPTAPAIKKVAGPSYYAYKTEKLTTLSLLGVIGVPAATQALPQETNLDRSPGMLLGEDDMEYVVIGGLDPASTGAIDTPGRETQTETLPEAPKRPALRDAALEGWSLRVEAGIASAIKAYYRENPEHLWSGADMRPNEAAADVLAAFERAGQYGLNPADYAVEIPQVGGDPQAVEKAAARFELALTAAALRYAADADVGRIDPNKISGYHDFPNYARDYTAYLDKIAGADAPAALLESMHPGNEQFAELMAELAELQASLETDAIEPVKPGTFIKPGMESEEMPKIMALIERKASGELKATHADTFAAYDGRFQFDGALVALVRDFQRENGLGADGIIGKNTISKMNVESPKARMDKIAFAMERLRWHPDELGNRHVFINQPAYRASYMVNGDSALSMKTVVGKPSNQTYFFHDRIKIVEVNPYWNVPRSIMINQKLGKIRANPGYLTANGYEVITARGITDPYAVNWYSGSLNGVQIRQKPGNQNALGDLKILFPNKHAIYMHDTPSRHLFDRSSRAYSAGCVRLHKPREMAAAVLGSTVEDVSRKIASGKTQVMKVDNQIPVYVAYFTAWPDDEGNIEYFADVYERDKALSQAFERTSELRAQAGVVAGS